MPDLLSADPAATVYLVEGEKDADRLRSIGLVATTTAQGATGWATSDHGPLAGRHVVLVPDNDEPGRAYAAQAARDLVGKAASVRRLELSGLSPKGDVSDWLDAGGTPEELHRLAAVAPTLEADGVDGPSAEELLKSNADERREVDRLASLTGSEVERERQIKAAAKALNCSVSALKADVARRQKETEPAVATGSGSPLEIEEPVPYPGPVEGAAVLNELRAELAGLVIMTGEAATATAMWVAFTYTIDAGTFSPRLRVKSPEKRCGKTTLLDALTEVCLRPLPASNITAAALFRTIERVRPTVILDEADTFMRDNEELRGLVNSGHRRSHAYVVRLVSVGDNFEPRKFSTWCPMAIAGIGAQHGTIEDRSIVVELKRKLPGETVRRMDEAARRRLRTLASKLRRWTDDHLHQLVDAYPAIPTGLHDRAADNWRPLLAIADAAGGDWPKMARDAALKLSGHDEADGLATMLLEDVRKVFAAKDGPERIGSKTLVSELVAMTDRPWPEASKGKALTETKLARLLKTFGIAPTHTRYGNAYLEKSFGDAWNRYLPKDGGDQTFTPSQVQEAGGCEAISNPSP